MQHPVDVLVARDSDRRPSRAASSTCRTRARTVRRPPRTRRARCGRGPSCSTVRSVPGASHQHSPSWCLATMTVYPMPAVDAPARPRRPDRSARTKQRPEVVERSTWAQRSRWWASTSTIGVGWRSTSGTRIAEVAAVPVGVLPDRRPRRHRRQVGVDEHAVAPLLPPRRHAHGSRSWHVHLTGRADEYAARAGDQTWRPPACG